MKAPLWMVLAALCLPALSLEAQTPPRKIVDCGTDSQQRVLCAAGGQVASARLVSDLSSNRCSTAGSWGWTGNALWADNSCRGRFEVSYRSADSSATRRITCGTLSRRRDQCSTEGVADSVRVVEEGIFASCKQGSNWGYTDSTVWAGNGCRAEFEVVYRKAAPAPTPAPVPAKPVTRTFVCGKASGELHTCEFEGAVDSVRLARELSARTCRQKVNWDYTSTFVWARDGCRGLFALTYRDTTTVEPAPATATRRVVCGSYSGRQVNCDTEGQATEVTLVRDHAGNRCREGTSWGHTDSIIWTKAGCRGQFDITYRVATPTTPHPRTTRITCGSASAIQVQCNTGGRTTDVRVVRNLGSSECREGYNWKHTGTQILAGRGCRAEFEVTFGSDSTPGMRPVETARRVITCGNTAGSAMSCNAFGTVATVRIQRDRSAARCAQSGSWGLNDQSIWVAKGCYADFELTYTSTLQ